MSRAKKYQAAEDLEESQVVKENQDEQVSRTVLPEDNIFNIDTKVTKPNQEEKTPNNNGSTSIENHNKFSKFKK